MKLLPKFKEIEDAEDFVAESFNILLWVAVMGISVIFLAAIWPLPPEPEWWTTIEAALGVTW